jgi:hypothetical protein
MIMMIFGFFAGTRVPLTDRNPLQVYLWPTRPSEFTVAAVEVPKKPTIV